MAVTQATYTGDGGATKSFSFPSIQQSDIKVTVDDVLKSSGTHYNITSYTTTGGGNVVFTSGNIPTSPQAIKIFRDTNVDVAKATFTAGSSVKAEDLNANAQQLLFRSQESDQLIVGGQIQNSAISTGLIADNAITAAKIANGNVNADKLASNSVTTVKIQDDAVTAAKLANSINTEIAANTAKLTNATHTGDVTGSGALTIANNAVNTAKIADDAVTTAKLANSIVSDITANNAKVTNATHTGEVTGSGALTIANNAVVEAKIANNAVTVDKIANNAVTVSKIADTELTTLAGMQSGTASVLADSTALTASTAELNQLDGITLETSVTTNSNTRIPTSKAVNDLVLSVTNALGGFVAIANETSFPTANPDPSNNAGTVVSISQLSTGLAVNGSGVATISNGAGTGNTVTITGFPANLQSQTLPASSGLQVQTTSTLHTYTFHKQLASAADIQAISATVNSFSNRYRVSASAPTSSLDGGDLWYDTTNSKLMVYSSANSAWEESSAIGNFFISTISSSSATGGGSATANGTAYRFTISDAPVSAAQLIVSVDGVIQKPNAGSSQPSEGFVLVGNDIIFGSAPANGASLFVTVIGSTVGIGTPSNNTVTSAILQNGSVTTAKIVDEAVTLAKLEHGTPSNNGKFLRANNGADPTFETVNTDLVADTSPQLGGDLQSNGNDIDFADNDKAVFGTGSDLKIYHDGNHSYIDDTGTGNTFIRGDDTLFIRGASNQDKAKFTTSGSVELYFDNNKKFETQTDGITVIGEVACDELDMADSTGAGNNRIKLGTGDDLQIYHNGTHSYLQHTQGSGHLFLESAAHLSFKVATNETAILANANGSVDLYYDNVKKFETTSSGATVTGSCTVNSSTGTSTLSHNLELSDAGRIKIGTGQDLQLYHDGSNSFAVNTGGQLLLRSTTGVQLGSPSGEPYVIGVENGQVELYYDNSKKLETTTYGIQTQGTGQVSLIVGSTNAGGAAVFLDGDSNGDASGGDYSFIRHNTSGNLEIVANKPSGGAYIDFYANAGNLLMQLTNNGHLIPYVNNSSDLGTSSKRWRNIYTNDLNLSNEGGANDVDNTWGDWTIQEGESDLFLKNNRSGKKYKFNLTEVS